VNEIGSNLVNKAYNAIEQERMLDKTEKNEAVNVLVALSGGADSMALLHFFIQHKNKLGIVKLSAAHINHMLRDDESERDENFVSEQCRALGIPLYLKKTDVAREAELSGEGLEEAGRRIRYDFFYEIALKTSSVIATAHTLSDSIETVLLNQARGCGLKGLYGIPPVREVTVDGKVLKIIRPLIYCTRAEIEEFCRENGIGYVTDSTNSQTDFARNRIRHLVVPNLKSINPDAESAFLRLMRHARQDGEFLDTLAGEALEKAAMKDGYGGYDAAALNGLPPALRSRAIIMAAKAADFGLPGKLTGRHIELIENILKDGGAVDLSCEIQARVSQGRFIINKTERKAKNNYIKNDIEIGISCAFYGKIYRPVILSLDEFEKDKKIHKNLLKYALNYDKISGKLYMRSRQTGDVFTPAGRGVAKKLKKLFIEEKIPAHLRDQIPVVCDAQGIVLVGGIGCDERVRIDSSCSRVLVFIQE